MRSLSWCAWIGLISKHTIKSTQRMNGDKRNNRATNGIKWILRIFPHFSNCMQPMIYLFHPFFGKEATLDTDQWYLMSLSLKIFEEVLCCTTNHFNEIITNWNLINVILFKISNKWIFHIYRSLSDWKLEYEKKSKLISTINQINGVLDKVDNQICIMEYRHWRDKSSKWIHWSAIEFNLKPKNGRDNFVISYK